MTAKLKQNLTKVRDLGSVLTHFIAVVMAIVAVMPPLLKTARDSGYLCVSALIIFILNMIGLYTASTIYHALDISPKINQMLRGIDHMMIFILITGAYTPVCMIVLGDKTGQSLLTLVWGITAVGTLINALRITCPKWFSSLIYTTVGWVCTLVITKILSSMPKTGFIQVLAGSITYTVDSITYVLKLPILDSRHKSFGSHEIFHLFIVGGSVYYYVTMYRFVAQRHCNAARMAPRMQNS